MLMPIMISEIVYLLQLLKEAKAEAEMTAKMKEVKRFIRLTLYDQQSMYPLYL